MSKRTNVGFAIALPLLAFGAMGFSGRTQQLQAPSIRACQVIVGDTIAIGQREYSLVATLSEELGDTLNASFPAESNVAIAQVKRGNVPKTVGLSVNAETALPGDWKLTISGNGNSCTGYVSVKQKPASTTPVKKGDQ